MSIFTHSFHCGVESRLNNDINDLDNSQGLCSSTVLVLGKNTICTVGTGVRIRHQTLIVLLLQLVY